MSHKRKSANKDPRPQEAPADVVAAGPMSGKD